MMSVVTERSIVPDGPAGVPILGNLPDLQRNPLRFLRDCGLTYGDLTRLRLAHYDAYLINSPALIHNILVEQVDHFMRFAGHKSSWLSRIVNGGARMDHVAQFPTDAGFWLRERWVIQPAFTPTDVLRHENTMLRHVQKMMAKWEDGAVRDIYRDMVWIAYSVVSESMFSATDDDDLATLHKAFEIIVNRIARQLRSLVLMPSAVPTKDNRALAWSVDVVDRAFTRLVEKHRAGGFPDDVINRMINAQDGDRTQNREWRFQAVSLFIAGYETTAVALSWLWVLLAQNLDVRTLVQRELREVLNGRLPTAEDIPDLKQTRAVFEETLRLYPPIWFFSPLIARDDCVVDGYAFRAGTIVLLSPWVTHHDPRFFRDPDRFYPQRWSETEAGYVNKYAYFPFGSGPRHCIGHSFATTEVMLTVATIAQSFELDLVEPDAAITPKAHVGLRPAQPVRMRISRRGSIN